MTRTLLAACLAALTLTIAAGCGGGSDDAGTPTATTMALDDSMAIASFVLGAQNVCATDIDASEREELLALAGPVADTIGPALDALATAPAAPINDVTGATAAEEMEQAAVNLDPCRPELAEQVREALP